MNNVNQIFYKFLFMTIGLSLLILSPKIVYSQDVKIQKQLLEFSQSSLAEYIKNVITEKNFANYGFKSLKETEVARPGDPYPVMVIGLKALKAYKSGTGAKPLLMDAKTFWFPVTVEGITRTKIEIIEKDGKWIAGEFGGVRTVKEIEIVKKQLPELLESKDIEAPYKIMLVKIPALYAEFLYIESSQGEFLISVMVQPERYKLVNGQMYTADEVLSKLREFAKEIDEKKVM